MIESFKIWLVRKLLVYCEEWLRNRELRNVKAYEMANFIPLRKFKK